MEINFDKESEIIELTPKKKYPKGHSMSISFCDDFVCFTFHEDGVHSNVQIEYEEWYQLKKCFELMGK